MTAFTVACLAALVTASAIGAGPPPRPTPHPPAALAATSLAWCGDVETPRADPRLYRDRPVYVGNEMPIGKIRRWARDKPGFVDLWIDRDNNGWISVMFTRDVARRQAELERRFPDVGVVAVQVQYSKRYLRRLARRVGDFVERNELPAGYGWGNADNVVSLSLPVVTDEVARELDSLFAGEPLCVAGRDPEELVQPGPQPLAGDGWRMLAWEQGRGPAHEVGIATDQASYEQLWQRTKLEGEPPAADFESEIAVWFAVGHGSSCPNQRMDEVIVDRERAQVYPLVVNPDLALACTDDLAGAYQFVAALQRAELPTGPFEIGLGGGGEDGLWRSLWVDADLSQPGSVAVENEIGKPPRRYPRSGTYQEPFGSFRYVMDASCGIGYLGVINDVHWVATTDQIPSAWAEAVEPDGELLVRVKLRTRPEPHAKVSFGGKTVRYEPAGEAPPVCAN